MSIPLKGHSKSIVFNSKILDYIFTFEPCLENYLTPDTWPMMSLFVKSLDLHILHVKSEFGYEEPLVYSSSA